MNAEFKILIYHPWVIVLFYFCGCAHYSIDSKYHGPEPLPENIIQEYSYEKFQGDYTETLTETQATYQLKKVTFKPTHTILKDSHEITIDYYDIDKSKKVPVIMILPILGGKNQESKFFAKYFAKHGYAAIIVNRQKHYKRIDNFDKLDSILRQMVFDHKQVIDWIEMRNELDASRIGVFGVSMGAIKGALLCALEPRIKASVLALVGGDLPEILSYSVEKGIVKKRNQLMKQHELTLDEFHELLTHKIQCDPINYAQYINAKNTLLILATFDRHVPYNNGIQFKEKVGDPERIYLCAGHYTALPYIFYVQQASLTFFNEHM
ncbi:MAG: dienelactone hydrolase family protein [Desulfobacterales bacterium]|nr:dienelactone hydrolase family protein [Desulfobacterales bacterium]